MSDHLSVDRKLLWRVAKRCTVVVYLWLCCLGYVSVMRPAPPTRMVAHHVQMRFEAPERP